jgi:hypothetical protein
MKKISHAVENLSLLASVESANSGNMQSAME